MKRSARKACRDGVPWKLFQLAGMIKNLSIMDALTPVQDAQRHAAIRALRILEGSIRGTGLPSNPKSTGQDSSTL